MEVLNKKVVLNFINIGGLFSIKEDKFIKIGKDFYDCIKDEKYSKYIEYCLFGGEVSEIDAAKTIPNAQIDISIGDKILHIVRMPQYTKTNSKGESVKEKELLSYKYGDKEYNNVSEKQLRDFIYKELNIVK